MRPARIPGADPEPLGAPPDWDEAKDGPCGALFIRRERAGDAQVMRSAWDVEHSEAAWLYAGAKLTLGISGNRHPVVQLGVGDLPAEFEPVVHARRYTDEKARPMVRVEMLFAHAGGRRSFCNVSAEQGFAAAVANGVAACEAVARREGWIE